MNPLPEAPTGRPSAAPEVPSGSGSDSVSSQRAVVAHVDTLADNAMIKVMVGDHQVALIRDGEEIHAIDNACPHQGYGLVTGALDGSVVTCQWHNWKFDAATGRCLQGEEDVACHGVEIAPSGEVTVEVNIPGLAERRARLWPSLNRGMAADYIGQVARDTVRLLDAGATPAQIMAEGLALAAPRTEYGVGHEMAMAADCLALSEIRTGDDRALPLIQGLSGLSEETRGRPESSLPEPDPTIDLVAAIEAEDDRGAMAAVLGALDRGDEVADLRHRFLLAASAHHLSYGHGIIYVQKSFELLDHLGWDRAVDILPHLARRLIASTREDTLPYMRRAMRAIEQVDTAALAATPDRLDTGWSDPAGIDTLLGADEAPIDVAVEMVRSGAGIEGLLDALTMVVSRRLLDHDLAVELDLGDSFGWLDITHGLTTAQAVRWAWRIDPGPHTARLALLATWLAFDTGRSERRHGRPVSRSEGHEAVVEELLRGGGTGRAAAGEGDTAELTAALTARDPERAATLAATGDPDRVAAGLTEAALADRAGSFIVMAHLIKTTQAAVAEAEVTTSSIPLAATARYLAAPRLERFVAANVAESIDFVRTGRPPRR